MEELPCSSDDSLEVVTDNDTVSVTVTEEDDTSLGRKGYGHGSRSEVSEVQSDGHLPSDETICSIMEVGAANEHVESEGSVDNMDDDSIEEDTRVLGGAPAYVHEEEHVSSTSEKNVDSGSGDTSTDETGYPNDDTDYQDNEVSEVDMYVHETDENGQEANVGEYGTREDTIRHGTSGYDADDFELADMEELPRSLMSLSGFGYNGTMQDEDDDGDTTESDEDESDDNTQDVYQNQMKVVISRKRTSVSFRLKEGAREEQEESSIEPKVINCSCHDLWSIFAKWQ